MQWHQLDHMPTICTSLQTDNHTNTPSLNLYRSDTLPDAQPTVSKHWRQPLRDTREKHKRYNIQGNNVEPPVGLDPHFHRMSVKQRKQKSIKLNFTTVKCKFDNLMTWIWYNQMTKQHMSSLYKWQWVTLSYVETRVSNFSLRSKSES